ncbi:septum site-determining protein MinC [Thermosipho sp. 1063]|uniref:septum site-determining protein MinC n=1 Tax=unclassified Thermosipho (in: thermotogales) TaxID=2676525 RepID=UPI0009494464|nr:MULTISPECIES: septum site-determining protein MinC [unclassified Thermosipho (in: thermotogales)]ANQ54048.1 septum site-determining protein MinC [Thermosipho sp. 1070]APT72493.1 septum site-determining protein MinC [Thermosipho sp. 1063]OOC42672.1 septum site-determining protein MinC [Thermosipho sp. 1074]
MSFDLKAFKSDIVFYIDEYDKIQNLLSNIDSKMKEIKHFFDGREKVLLKVKNLKEKICDVPKIIEKLEEYNIKTKAIITDEFDEKNVTVENKEEEKEKTIILIKNLRSGQKITHNGNIILVGNVHVGSEINAGGSVVIFGSCHGLIKAGLRITPAYILTLSLNSPLIQINDIKHQLSKTYNNPTFIYSKGGKLIFDEIVQREEKL